MQIRAKGILDLFNRLLVVGNALSVERWKETSEFLSGWLEKDACEINDFSMVVFMDVSSHIRRKIDLWYLRTKLCRIERLVYQVDGL